MTPEDARKLLGGYATGSITEAERKALFEAALVDQELFDELAGEQVLKEVLDEPGARQRLLVALERPRHRAWLWGWAGASAAVAIAVVIGVVILNRTPPPEPPQQIAQVLKSPEPANAPAAPPLPEPPPVRQKVAPAPAPAPEPPAELKKEEALADRLQEVKPQATPQATEAARGFVAGAPAAAALRSENAAVKAASVFAFSYAVGADGFLQIVPAEPGFLSVTAGNAIVFPSAAVSAGRAVRIAIPSDAASLEIAYSAAPGITGSPVRRDEASGTVTDQDPPNSRILIQLFLKPATR